MCVLSGIQKNILILSLINFEINLFIREMLTLGDDPLVGIPLVGSLKGYYKLRFDFYGISYRIIYEPKPDDNVVYILLLGPRQNIYKKMRRFKRRR